MADKQEAPFTFVDASVLSKEILSLASKRLDALCEKSRKEQIAKLLYKRRRRWRKRHKLDSQSHSETVCPGLDVELQGKKELLEETSMELKCSLANRRDRGHDDAMALQTQESLHSLEVFKHRLSRGNETLQAYVSHSNMQEPRRVPPDHMDISIIKDLEATISQAKAFSEIKKMKHAMTPRVPQLHNRTLSGNIFDQSLGLLHDSDSEVASLLLDKGAQVDLQDNGVGVAMDSSGMAMDSNGVAMDSSGMAMDSNGVAMDSSGMAMDSSGVAMDSNGITPELLDSEHAHLQVGEEVSIWQEDPGGDSDSGGGGVEAREVEAASSEFPDDTPGIGMEVVCEEASSDAPGPGPVALHNGLNGLNNGAEDSDGEIHFKILRLFQDARYDLRFPVRRYSNQASMSKHIRTSPPSQTSQSSNEVRLSPASTSAVPASKRRGRPRKNQTPSQCVSASKRRGRPRKNESPPH